LALEKTDAAVKLLNRETLRKVIDVILTTPNGVQTMSTEIEGFVQTSSNIGIVETSRTGKISVNKLLRSSVTEELSLLLQEMDAKATEAGAFASFGSMGGKPWQYKADSPLRDTLIAVYEDIYGESPITIGSHGYVECGIFAEKMPDCEFISVGPTIENAHSPDERMSLSSFNRTCIYLVRVLEAL